MNPPLFSLAATHTPTSRPTIPPQALTRQEIILKKRRIRLDPIDARKRHWRAKDVCAVEGDVAFDTDRGVLAGRDGGIKEADLLVAEEAVGEDWLVRYVFVAMGLIGLGGANLVGQVRDDDMLGRDEIRTNSADKVQDPPSHTA